MKRGSCQMSGDRIEPPFIRLDVWVWCRESADVHRRGEIHCPYPVDDHEPVYVRRRDDGS